VSEGNYGNPGNEGPEHSRAHLDHRPNWKHAHRDWRVWVGLFFCLAAIIIYVLSEDLSFMPGGRPHQTRSSAATK
jgi:hypothetical protein